jgi:hypothetical protein
MEETNGAALRVVRAERVRTNQLCQLGGFVHGGRTNGAHFVQDDGNTSVRHLPSGLATGKPASDDVNRANYFCHFAKLGRSPPDHNLMGINPAHHRYAKIRDDPAQSGVSYSNSERQGTHACSK